MRALLGITSSPRTLRAAANAFLCAVPFYRPLATAHEPTIFAPATGRGKTAISILRISGPESLRVWDRMTKPPRSSRLEQGGRAPVRPPTPRRATLRRIVHPETGEVLDEGIVLFFPASSALTSQPTLELHLHGSPALMALMLNLLPTLSPSFRIAEPGEFTRLAFEAGKMDLTEVEGIRDLVEADTEAQRKLAARQAGGHMRKAYDQMRTSVIESMSLVEALIDFGEDEGISEGVFDQAKLKVSNLLELVKKHLDDGRRGEIIRSGFQIAIIGPPNAGKSSLLNWFAQRDAAIVTAKPGTTRDIVEVSLDFHGFAVTIADTAGIRETEDEVEAIGVERAKQRALEADLKVLVLDASDPVLEDQELLGSVDSNTIVVLNKSDLQVDGQSYDSLVGGKLLSSGRPWIGKYSQAPFRHMSVKDGTGLDEFTEGLKALLAERFKLSDDLDDTPLVTHARHRRHLEECVGFLEAFLTMGPDDIVLAAEELRYATQALGRITGAVDVEEVLGEIFRGFCIGK